MNAPVREEGSTEYSPHPTQLLVKEFGGVRVSEECSRELITPVSVPEGTMPAWENASRCWSEFLTLGFQSMLCRLEWNSREPP